MRAVKHWRSAAAFGVVMVAFVLTGVMLSGGEFYSRSQNDDPRSVLVEAVVLGYTTGDGTDPDLRTLLDKVRPGGEVRLLTASEFDEARLLASRARRPGGLWHAPTLIAQHRETSTTHAQQTGGGTTVGSAARHGFTVQPAVLKDNVVRVVFSLSEETDSANGSTKRGTEMTFTSRGGAAVAAVQFGGLGSAEESVLVLVRPTIVVDRN